MPPPGPPSNRSVPPTVCSHGTMKIFRSRYSVVMALGIYLAGLFSGTFFCSVATIEQVQPKFIPLTRTTVQRSSTVNAVQNHTIEMKNQPGVAVSAENDQSDADKRVMAKEQPYPTAPKAIRRRQSKRKVFKPTELRLPTPIMVMGLMKAGTTSIYGYFKCGLDPEHSQLSHYDCKPGDDPSQIGMACGKRMRRNLTKYSKPAFFTMDQFDLYAELDAQELNGGMTLPQWEFLQAIHDQFPQATWILNLRAPHKWLDSVDRWKDLRQRFVDLHYVPEFHRGKGVNDTAMIDFYNLQAQRVRDFVATHPSHTLVEVEIDSPDAGKIMEDAFGIPQTCWGDRNVNNGAAVWVEQ